MVSGLYSCGVLGAQETGKWVHFYIKKKKLKLTVTLETALSLLTSMKSVGLFDEALHCIKNMPMEPNVI